MTSSAPRAVNPLMANMWACRLTQSLARWIARGVQSGATRNDARGTSSSHIITRLKPITSSTVVVVEYLSLWISWRPARYEAPGSVRSAPTMNVVRADPLLSSRCQRGGRVGRRLPSGDELEPRGERYMNVFQGRLPVDNTEAPTTGTACASTTHAVGRSTPLSG